MPTKVIFLLLNMMILHQPALLPYFRRDGMVFGFDRAGSLFANLDSKIWAEDKEVAASKCENVSDRPHRGDTFQEVSATYIALANRQSGDMSPIRFTRKAVGTADGSPPSVETCVSAGETKGDST
jgi:hypothetical protein